MPNPYALSLWGKEPTTAEKLGISLYDTGKTYSNSAEKATPPMSTVKDVSYDYGLSDSNDYSLPSDFATKGGASFLAGANPYVLAATVGLGYLQQRAADARAKREREAQIIQSQASNEANILGNLSNQYGRTLIK